VSFSGGGILSAEFRTKGGMRSHRVPPTLTERSSFWSDWKKKDIKCRVSCPGSVTLVSASYVLSNEHPRKERYPQRDSGLEPKVQLPILRTREGCYSQNEAGKVKKISSKKAKRSRLRRGKRSAKKNQGRIPPGVQ